MSEPHKIREQETPQAELSCLEDSYSDTLPMDSTSTDTDSAQLREDHVSAPAVNLNLQHISLSNDYADLTHTTFDLEMLPQEKSKSEERSVRSLTDPLSESLPQVKPRRYRVLSLLGRGGMADVWLARDLHLGREVALKLIKANLPSAQRAVRMEGFEIEARVMSQLDHPGILPVFDFLSSEEISREVTGIGEVKQSTIGGYTMRVASYQSFAERLAQRSLDLREICSIIKQVSLTAEHAHKRGVIHRDIKPHNILLGNEGEVYLTDWGICLLTEEHPDYARVSEPLRKLLAGSLHFMAPEQAEQDRAVDHRADVYGIGATLYFALTAQPPRRGSFSSLQDLINATRSQEVTSPEELCAHQDHFDQELITPLSQICMRALERSPDDRFESARELASELERFLSGQLEREKRRRLCEDALRRGEEERARFQDLSHARQTLLSDIKRLTRQEMKTPKGAQRELLVEELRGVEEEVERLDTPLEESFSRSVASYREALIQDSSSEDASRALGELFWFRYEEARRRGEHQWEIYFESQFKSVAPPGLLKRLYAPSSLTLIGVPQGTSLEVFKLELSKYHVHETSVFETYVKGNASPISLSRGVYLLKLRHPRAAEVKVPVTLEGSERRTIKVNLPLRDRVPEGYVYIRDRWCLQTYPVTVSEYFGFLNELPAAKAVSHAPRYYNTIYAEPNERGVYEAPFADIEGDEWSPLWPVMLVSHEDARAYCDWLTARLGRVARLPSAEEWLEAAQGPDQRPYPWGRSFDARLCSVRASQTGRPTPTPVGSAESDRSVYGVHDVAGTIMQWTESLYDDTADYYRVMGAAFNSMSFLSELTQELQAGAQACLTHIGFRTLIELGEEDMLTPESTD